MNAVETVELRLEKVLRRCLKCKRGLSHEDHERGRVWHGAYGVICDRCGPQGRTDIEVIR